MVNPVADFFAFLQAFYSALFPPMIQMLLIAVVVLFVFLGFLKMIEK